MRSMMSKTASPSWLRTVSPRIRPSRRMSSRSGISFSELSGWSIPGIIPCPDDASRPACVRPWSRASSPAPYANRFSPVAPAGSNENDQSQFFFDLSVGTERPAYEAIRTMPFNTRRRRHFQQCLAGLRDHRGGGYELRADPSPRPIRRPKAATAPSGVLRPFLDTSSTDRLGTPPAALTLRP